MSSYLQTIEAARAFVRIGVEDQVTAFLAGLQSRLNRTANAIGRIGSQLGSFGLGGTIFGGALVYGLNRTVEAASEATEVNTAYAATFRELTEEGEKFANLLTRRLGRNIVQVKDIQRSFFGLFAGQGFTRDFALAAANAFTQLSYDFGSFFNQSTDEASRRLLSALSNSAEVVQRFGFNVRAAALESGFKDLGINKTIEQASEQEKTLARALILLKTSSDAQLNVFGDVERTINEFANQRRRLLDNLQVLLRAIGRPLELALAPFFGEVSRVVQGFAEIIRTNPQVVKRLSVVTAVITAVSTVLIGMGFALRVAAFSLKAFTSPITTLATLLIRLPDLIIRPTFELTRLAVAGVRVLGVFGRLTPVVGALYAVWAQGSQLALQATFHLGALALRVAYSIERFLLPSIQQIPAAASAAVQATATAATGSASSAAAAAAATYRGIASSTRLIGHTVAVNALVPLANTGRIVGLSMAGHISLFMSRLRRIPARIAAIAANAVSTISAAIVGITPGIQLLGNQLLNLSAIVLRVFATVSLRLATLFAANPLVTFIAAVTALLLAFRDEIAGAFTAITDRVKSFGNQALNAVSRFVAGAVEFFGQLVAFAKERFVSLFDIAKTVFAGLNNAIQAGDLQLAFQIALSGMRVALLDFLNAFLERWGDSVGSVTESLFLLRGRFQEVWIQIVGFVRQAFREIREIAAATSDVIARGLIAAQEKVGLVPAGTVQTLEEDIQRRLENDQRATRAQIEADVQQALRSAEAATKLAVTGVRGKLGSLQQNIAGSLTVAREELQRLTEAAAAANVQPELPPLQASEDFLKLIQEQNVSLEQQATLQRAIKGVSVFSSAGTDIITSALNASGLKNMLSEQQRTTQAIVGLPPAFGEEMKGALDDVEVADRQPERVEGA
ncbi:MAG: hypothetical protein RIK87_08415 [Fuerstiella sp.]